MAENDNNGLWIVVLAAAGYVTYEIWKQKKCATGSVSSPNGAAPAVANANATTLSNVNYPSSGTTAPSLINPGGIPVVQNPDNGMSLPAGVSQTQYSVVQNWALSWGQPPGLALISADIPSEYQTVYDYVTAVYQNGVTPTADQSAAWQALANKYDPTHKYW